MSAFPKVTILKQYKILPIFVQMLKPFTVVVNCIAVWLNGMDILSIQEWSFRINVMQVR